MKLNNIMSRRNRILLRELIITDFKLRYQGSVLGYIWSILKPLMLFAILYVVFGYILKMSGDVDHYSVYLLVGIVMWNFFTEATQQGLQSIVNRGSLIRKINFPKYIIVISGTTSALINLFFNFIVVIFFIVINGVHLSPVAFLAPLLVIELYLFALATAMLLSSVNVKFRDIGYLWEIVLQGAFYATPILYSIDMVVKKSRIFAEAMLLNPVAQVLQDLRYVLVTHKSTTLWTLSHHWYIDAIPFLIIILVTVCASVYFRRNSKYFAEYV